MKAILIAAGLGVSLLAAGQSQDWADDDYWTGFEESKALCRSVRDREPPQADRATAAQAAALAGCSSEAFYYGIGMPADPVRARQCAFLEDNQDWPFAGRAMLMTIYANGVGAERDLDLAIHLACLTDGAPAERDGRVRHLAELRASGWTGTDFHYCDDITSGLSGGYCTAHEAGRADARQAAELGQLAAGWTAAERAAFALLEEAQRAYASAHGEGEIDLSGTLRAALQIGAEQRLHDQFMEILQRLSRGEPPPTRVTITAADAALNQAYRARLAEEFYSYPGAITREGVRNAQRAWLRYRDSFLDFAEVKFPTADRRALAAWLTEQRTERLTETE